ncbi:SIR2 family protein [Variovorax sp. Root473]|uniref:SIR2 family protein n=1 Tax=Variovorax sp. Root473 TaxID=1736541 RepID=UPI0006FD420A|nr:SIR2 family protein [Variovorax sp. Root473]KQX90565.1 hypothetical protein ASD34_04780 [Variovorax sp. Root473]
MIDPIDSLAFSMHANKGVFAVLLGSGVSRSARVPTGWEVTIELVRKAAALQGANCEPDPAAWFLQTTGKEADYSALLDAVAKTPAERQQLLRSYFEPTDAERDEGAKMPTKAHRAIAELVKLGYVRVVLTTNFDRLLEVALNDVGVYPTVLSTPDHIEGALPLVHTGCTIVKVHGDYLDTRIRNTPEELSAYPEQFNRLLDRVFDEFGMVVAGWSADWDEALRSAMTRAPYRRFSTYWSSRGKPSAKAADLIARRGATLVNIEDADSFFHRLAEKVKSLEEFSRPHPLSAAVAVASLKRYLSEQKHRISLNDLVNGEIAQVASHTTGPGFDVNDREVSGQSVLNRLRAYEAVASTLMQMAFVAGQWSEGEQLRVWERALTSLATRRAQGGVVLWSELQRYPATLLLYAMGMGAVLAERWETLHRLFSVHVGREGREDKRVVEVVPIWGLFELGADAMKVLPGREREHTPLQNHIEGLLLDLVGAHFDSPAAFSLVFDRFEVMAALAYAAPQVARSQTGERYWTLPGAYGWRSDNRQRIFQEVSDSLTSTGDGSPLVTSRLVGATAELGQANLKELQQFIPQFRWR